MQSKQKQTNHKKTYRYILIISGLFLVGYYITHNKKVELTKPPQYVEILKHQKEWMTNSALSTDDKKQLQEDCTILKQLIVEHETLLSKAKTYKKQLDNYSDAIQTKEDEMFEAQDHALYVGKFICKLNTCQGDPKHENYAAFVNATDNLVAVKESLQKAKDTYSHADEEVDKIDAYEDLIKDLQDTYTQLQKES